MNPHAEAILKKMQADEYPKLNVEFAVKLTNESERGAILIGTGKIEEFVERLICTILPSDSKSYKNRLLKYPGSLSSFSGKIELLYAFRIINERLYNSLNVLRSSRNLAAHSSETFSLQEMKQDLEKIYDFEDGFPEVIHELAYKRLIQFKIDKVKEGFESDDQLKHLDAEKHWHESIPNPDEYPIIQEHLTVWKLAHGLTFLCLKLQVIQDEYEAILDKKLVWTEVIK